MIRQGTRRRCSLLAMLAVGVPLSGCIGEGVGSEEIAFETAEQKKTVEANACATDKDCSDDALHGRDLHRGSVRGRRGGLVR